MTQGVNVRPGTVTAAQAIIWVLAVLGALGSALMLVLGVVGLVSGASVAAGASGTEASGLGAAFGGLIGFFAGGLIVVAVISLAFVGLWCWIAVALGRASRPARIILTVFCGIDLVWGLLMLLAAASDEDMVTGIVPALVLLAIPATLMGLLWGSESSRRFFAGVPSAYTPAPVSPPVGFAQPPFAQQQWGQQQWGQQQAGQQQYGRPQYGQQQQYGRPQQYGQQPSGRHQVADVPDDVTARITLPAQRCGTCQAELRAGSPSCGGCGAPVTPPRPVGA
jgi:hypothetical protein